MEDVKRRAIPQDHGYIICYKLKCSEALGWRNAIRSYPIDAMKLLASFRFSNIKGAEENPREILFVPGRFRVHVRVHVCLLARIVELTLPKVIAVRETLKLILKLYEETIHVLSSNRRRDPMQRPQCSVGRRPSKSGTSNRSLPTYNTLQSQHLLQLLWNTIVFDT